MSEIANLHAHHTDGPPDEEAYRRGFQQGAELLWRSLQEGATDATVRKWLIAVWRWRFLTTHKKRSAPPDLQARRTSERKDPGHAA